MLVYGDHRELADPGQRIGEIQRRLERILPMTPSLERHSSVVATLIDAGRLWQGLADEDFAQQRWDRRTRTSDAMAFFLLKLARCVRRSWSSGFAELGELPSLPVLEDIPPTVELRLPEGFACYAVYPEAYAEAARRLRLAAAPRIIGIRSIGTTLAVMAAAALDAPPPITVRPHGDPFAREVAIAPELERELLAGKAHYVIVDEGPGQSGSSFGAIADWLEKRGVPLERIAFLPSHDEAPGSQASEAHRRRWERAQRAPAHFAGRLPVLLGSWTEARIGPLDGPLEDISGGKWRGRCYSGPGEWPAAYPQWERLKFIAEADGEQYLLKFAGLGAIAERKLAMARALHAAGFSTEPVGLVHGFLVERWRAEARPLTPADRPIAVIARYIGARARLFPASGEAGASLDELFKMCRRNVALASGEEHLKLLESWAPKLDPLSRRVVRTRSDNRMLPHEWLRRDDGALLKTDAFDHHTGHDLIGCQDLAWDVAGVIEEFGLGDAESGELVARTEQAAGREVDGELLDFYRIAYLAFRIGQESLTSSDEDQRHAELAQHYQSRLRDVLSLACGAATRRECLVG